MRALVDREQRRRHRDIDILALPGVLPAVERCKNRNHGLQAGIDVGMRQAIGTRLGERAAIVTNTVFGKAGLGLHGWRIGHPATPWTALAVAGDRRIDQARVAFGQRLVIKTEEAWVPR